MNEAALARHILQEYGTPGDHPFASHPDYTVFRHAANRKWFCVVMTVPREKLGLPGSQPLAIANLKCDPRLAGSLRLSAGIYPAYHMSKDTWISAALDVSVPDGTLKALLAMSYEATRPRRRAPKLQED